ncbi:hypothetical protein R1flu_020803 [Riccia fluitans]|uniref:Uncharacterized protein n=1 Tax=Riccia fluitans TaxID=41844 RepID=A0ABD1ZMW0_9MARC
MISRSCNNIACHVWNKGAHIAFLEFYLLVRNGPNLDAMDASLTVSSFRPESCSFITFWELHFIVKASGRLASLQ